VRLEYLRHLSGPNVFTAAPVCIARVELGDLTGRETTDYPGFAERLTLTLPGLRDHHCAAGRRGGFTDAMAKGTYFGHVTDPPGPHDVGRRGRPLRRDDGVPAGRAR
jgi:cyanophycin synthetase